MCKWKSCLKPSRQEEESFSSRVFGGLYVSPVNRVSSSAAARHWCCRRKGLAEALGRCQPAVSHSWRTLAGDGKRQEKGKTSHARPFPCLPNIKLFSPRSRCTTGPVAASEPKSDLSSRHRLQGAMARYHQGLCSSLLPQLP